MIGLASLGSGSRGNGTLICFEDELLLIDCGFTLKQAEARLARLGVLPSEITAILVTHEHADHAAGVAALAHRYALPVYASYGTLKSGKFSLFGTPFDGDVPFQIGTIEVNPVRVPHDAREPTQFVLSGCGVKIGVLSDLGCPTPHVSAQFEGCDLLMLEANHDRAMLMSGRYPPKLKRRVGSDLGHLSNTQAAQLLDEVAHPELRVVVGHVSEENNSEHSLTETFDPLRERVASIEIATQNTGLDWLLVRGEQDRFKVPLTAQQDALALGG